MQVEASAVSGEMVRDAEAAEKLAQSKLHSKTEALNKEDFEKELSKIATSSDSIQRKASSLRQVIHEKLINPKPYSCSSLSEGCEIAPAISAFSCFVFSPSLGNPLNRNMTTFKPIPIQLPLLRRAPLFTSIGEL